MGICDESGHEGSRKLLLRPSINFSLTVNLQTIRSDPTFGAYQILKLFLEYVSKQVIAKIRD